MPRTLSNAAGELSWETGQPEVACREKLQEVLLRGLQAGAGDHAPLFAFKLHQFISQGPALMASLAPPATRQFALEGQRNSDPRTVWAPLYFCRVCGQDHWRVTERKQRFVGAPGSSLADENDRLSYLTPVTQDTEDLDALTPPRNGARTAMGN